MSQQNPLKELKLNFNIDLIKSKIEEIVKISGGNYSFTDKNDVFNTYRIGIVSGITGGIMSITLTSIDDKNTLWKSEIMKMSGQNNKTDNTPTLARLQDEFLSILSKGLAGEEITKELFKANKTGGCLGVLIALISIPSLILYSLLS